MLYWSATTSFPLSEIEADDLLKGTLQADDSRYSISPQGEKFYLCPITSYGYEGLHVFIWGCCRDMPSWTIDPLHPELMGNDWMCQNWSHHELDNLLELLEDLYTEITSMAGEIHEVTLAKMILPVHEEEALEHFVRPLFPGPIQAMRPNAQRFYIAEQAQKVRAIHSFVKKCKTYGADIVWVSLYGR